MPASIAGDTFKTSYAYDAIKMYGSDGAELTTGLDPTYRSIMRIKNSRNLSRTRRTVKKYYVSTAFEPTAEAPDGSWDGWTVRDDAGYPAS